VRRRVAAEGRLRAPGRAFRHAQSGARLRDLHPAPEYPLRPQDPGEDPPAAEGMERGRHLPHQRRGAWYTTLRAGSSVIRSRHALDRPSSSGSQVADPGGGRDLTWRRGNRITMGQILPDEVEAP